VITAVRTELFKIRTTRLVLGLFGVAAGLTILGAVISALRAGGTGSGAIPSLSTAVGQRAVMTFTGFGLLMALVVGITIASGEFRHRTATDTYIDEPNRARVMTAKTAAAAITGAFFGLAISAIATGVGLAFVVGKGYEVVLATDTIARFAAGATLGAGLLASIGVGLGSLVRQELAALITIFVWALAVEQISAGISRSLAAYLPIMSAGMMAGATSTAAMPPIPPGVESLPFGAVAGLLAAIASVIAIVAARTSLRRDVT
jgi:ABC-2 type transport system permease protein